MVMSKASEFSEYLRENYPVNKSSTSGRKLRYDVGFNDSDYLTQPRVNGAQIRCPVYITWVGILMRIYDENKRKNNIAYRDCKVCDEWLIFSNFRKWFIENHIDTYELDKDILVLGNKTYSPETCVYVPSQINSFIVDNRVSRGNYMIGVSWDATKNKFLARCRNPNTKKQKNLGSYTEETDAYKAWLKYKLELALELKSDMDKIDLRIYPNIVTIIKTTK